MTVHVVLILIVLILVSPKKYAVFMDHAPAMTVKVY